MTDIDQSFAHCAAIARARAKNFYYSFLVLPREKRLAMCAIYAFMRECDDLSDEAGATRARIEDWRHQMEATLAGQPPEHPVWAAFGETVRRHRIPPRYFHEMLDGVSSDLEPRRVVCFDDLYRYCYLVASVVGLTTIHIFGFKDPHAPELAERCGVAFQLTNIIRDVGEDARLGRIYLPEDDRLRFGVTDAMLSGSTTTPQLRRLLTELGDRARGYYNEARPLIAMVDADSRPALWALIEIYSRLLERMAKNGYDVLPQRESLSKAAKLRVLALAWLRRALP
jgi:phytoene synthase